MKLHRTRGAVLGVLLLAASACGTAASNDASGPAGETTTTVAPVSGPETDGSTSSRPRSPLAEQVTPIGPATYDPAEHEARTRVPASLRIGAIGVSGAGVVDVGVEPNGEMEIPGADEVGWYRFGSAPGEDGSAVLAAHIAYNGVDGVFRYLDGVDVGAEVVVGMSDGTELRYEITELATYDKQELPDDVFSRAGPGRLVLITCGGEFNPSLRSYESNVVAYAAPV